MRPDAGDALSYRRRGVAMKITDITSALSRRAIKKTVDYHRVLGEGCRSSAGSSPICHCNISDQRPAPLVDDVGLHMLPQTLFCTKLLRTLIPHCKLQHQPACPRHIMHKTNLQSTINCVTSSLPRQLRALFEWPKPRDTASRAPITAR
jgi:hypothetical protein